MRTIIILCFPCYVVHLLCMSSVGAHIVRPPACGRWWDEIWDKARHAGRWQASSPTDWILGLRQIFRSLHGAMGASRPTDYFTVHHTFSNVTQPNIFERRICAAIHHNYSLFFITYSFYSPIIPPTQQIVDITKTALRSPGRRFQLFRLSRSISYFYNN